MRLTKRILQASKNSKNLELSKLNIDFKKREEIIKCCYDFMGRLFRYPSKLNKSIEFVKGNNLEGEGAYNSIKERLEKHDEYLSRIFDNPSKNYPNTDISETIIS